MSDPGFAIRPEPLTAFEDIIDGYFPLRTSITHLLERLGSPEAVLEMAYAPIMEIPDLSPDAPVPLQFRDGRLGLIDRLFLLARWDAGLSGLGTWRWFAGDDDSLELDPMTRLAEPAFVQGFAPLTDGAGFRLSEEKEISARWIDITRATPSTKRDILDALGWSGGELKGPIAANQIIAKAGTSSMVTETPASGAFLITRSPTHRGASRL